MRNDILASFYHCSSTDENPTHQLCPKTKDSWCFFNNAIANEKVPNSHKSMKVHFQLSPEELTQVKDVYDRLTSDEIMMKCLAGRTQNPNESLHARIWRISPKHKNGNKPMLDFACAVAVANYNAGYETSCLDTIMGLERTKIRQKILQEQDRRMNMAPRIKMYNNKLQEELAYAAGGF